MKIEIEKPKDKSFEAALASEGLDSKATKDTNGAYVTYTVYCTHLEAFKLGRIFQHLSNI